MRSHAGCSHYHTKPTTPTRHSQQQTREAPRGPPPPPPTSPTPHGALQDRRRLAVAGAIAGGGTGSHWPKEPRGWGRRRRKEAEAEEPIPTHPMRSNPSPCSTRKKTRVVGRPRSQKIVGQCHQVGKWFDFLSNHPHPSHPHTTQSKRKPERGAEAQQHLPDMLDPCEPGERTEGRAALGRADRGPSGRATARSPP